MARLALSATAWAIDRDGPLTATTTGSDASDPSIFLGRIRLLFLRLRFFLGFRLDDRLRRLGLLLDRLLDGFRRRLGRRVGLDQLFLLGDLADGVFLGLGLGDLLDLGLRLFFVAG